MIPSDHFVKFYAEAFKYLEKKGPEAVQKYYDSITEHQKTHCLENFKKNGLQGMYNYWSKIRIEENCDMDIFFSEDHKSVRFIMNGCPSLGKVLDNDAGMCPIYCNHCPGWVLPLLTAAGFYCVYDLVAMDMPRCCSAIFENIEDARAYRKIAEKRNPAHPELIACNFD